MGEVIVRRTSECLSNGELSGILERYALSQDDVDSYKKVKEEICSLDVRDISRGYGMLVARQRACIEKNDPTGLTRYTRLIGFYVDDFIRSIERTALE